MHSCLLLTFFPSKTVWADHKSATGDLAAVHYQRDACVAGTFAKSDCDVDSTPKSENVRLVFKHFIPILSETSNFLLEACRERAHRPHKQIVPVTQLIWGCMPTLACEGSAAAGGSNTHALLCVNPAPPVAQSGSSLCHPHVMCWNKLRLKPF